MTIASDGGAAARIESRFQPLRRPGIFAGRHMALPEHGVLHLSSRSRPTGSDPDRRHWARAAPGIRNRRLVSTPLPRWPLRHLHPVPQRNGRPPR
jgi:hypothetical protein